jgi:amino acid adenylation domain-containing protein
LEKTVSGIWEGVLNKSHIDTNDNFFDLGGNSVAIMKVISRTVSALKVPVTIDDLFKYPTLGEFSALIEKYKMDLENIIVEEKPELSDNEKLSGVLASFAQQRFWFLHQYENNADVFNNVSEVVKLIGHVDIDALSKTIEYLSSRHEALRTVFFMKDGLVYQKILNSVPDTLSIIDFSKENTEIKEKLVSEYLDKELRRSFDFQNGPLFHCNLMKITDGEYMFVFVIHHIISDGWSVGIFINELMEAYQKYCLNLLPSLQEIEWQYSEYSVWQKNKLTNGIMDKQLAYWKEKLKGMTELNFPLDYERPAMQSFSGSRKTYQYSKKLMDKVTYAAKNAGTTTFVVYQAALNVLLSRYSGQEDIMVGSPVTKRPLREVENTIGCFLNTLVFRNDLTGNPTFKELIKRVSQTSVDAFNNQDIPFEVLVDKMGVTRDLSKNPLYQIMLLFQNEPHPDQEIAALKVERLNSENKASMVDLSISMEETKNGVSVLYEYNTDLFMAETIERISIHFERILDILCSDTNLRINDFDYMPKEEMKHILYGFNDTKVTFDTDLFIQQLFEELAEKHPEREALRFRELSLTYKELNIRINKLANYLLTSGIRKRQMIAVYMERSVEMVVALYGILKAGAAYVPVDPDYPEERVKYMLEDSNVEVVLTQSDKADVLKEYSLRTIILGEGDITSSASEENPNVSIEEEDYAYMIYTSGSTGRPKGVINTHKGIRNRVLWMRTAFPVRENGRQMQKTPFSFDVSCGEFFGALTVGGCLVVAEPGGHKDVDYLIDLINREKITNVHFVPSMLKAFLYSPRVSEVKGIKQVCCTGEPLPYSLVERFKQIFTDAEIFNLYGPTEAAVEVTSWRCRKKLYKNIIPIGTPIANTQLYILDRNLRPVPVGVCGELNIAGDNLAAGYHNREELTAERFIPNPYSDESNPIMYKTGDVAKFLPDGEIDFIGRIDNQVKIRGNRIELSEIEVNIGSYSGVSEVHVIVSKEETPRIIAYIVLEDKTMDNLQRNGFISELREHLRKKLPEYMIPSFIMVLDEMPLLPNGKFNMKELPLPAVSRDYVTNSYTEASGDTELKLKQIWSEVLNTKVIGTNDNFFEIGGHSLLLIEVYNKLKVTIDTNLTVVDMFKYATIRSLSKYINDMKNSGGDRKEIEEETKNIKAGTQDRRRNSARLKELHKTV